MRNSNIKKIAFPALSILIILFLTASLLISFIFPSNLLIVEGEEYINDELLSPLRFEAFVKTGDSISLNGSILEKGQSAKINGPLSIKSDNTGNYNIDISFLGFIPVRSIQVSVVPKAELIPMGTGIGVKLFTRGVLVVGIGNVETQEGRTEPAKDAGIKTGDIILSVDNNEITDSEQFKKLIQKEKPLHFVIERNGKKQEVEIIPAISTNDSKYRIGLWVRDSTAGIGTMTFFDPQTKRFAALGHGITDIDTEQMFHIKNGTIHRAYMTAVKKGLKGEPGELIGVFKSDTPTLGNIFINSQMGIYGEIISTDYLDFTYSPMPIGTKDKVTQGKASILSNIDKDIVTEYEIEIVKVMKYSQGDTKGMVIKVTDSRLLNKTGGIVQGMSGSPIIQDGKIIGAVTHVFINDPSKGYGIFIESMLSQTSFNSQNN